MTWVRMCVLTFARSCGVPSVGATCTSALQVLTGLHSRQLNGKPVRERRLQSKHLLSKPVLPPQRLVKAVPKLGIAAACHKATVSLAHGKAARPVHEPVYRPVALDGNAAGKRQSGFLDESPLLCWHFLVLFWQRAAGAHNKDGEEGYAT